MPMAIHIFFVYDYDTASAADLKDLLNNFILECYDLNGNYIHNYDVFKKHGYDTDTFGNIIENILNEKVDAFRESEKNKNGSTT